MRASTAYFAGAGTVIAAIVGGVGGGLLIADMVSPKSPKGTEMSRLERRISPEPIQVTTKPSEPVPYLASPQQGAASSAPTAALPAQTEAVNSASTAAQQTAATSQPVVQATQPAAPTTQPPLREQMVARQAVAPEDAFARTRDADVKRAAEKRRAERRQQWADKRRHQQRQELQAVEESVREETEPRRQFAPEPVKIEMRQIRLFGEE
jgi:hypothetical protein